MELSLATEAEKQQRDALSFEAWGGGLSVVQYVEREVELRATAWAKAEMETWLWRDDAGMVVSSCETFRCDSQVGYARGNTWAIASVFTERALRGKGYAAGMINALCEELRTRPRAQASVLFSEVGASLYRRCRYQEQQLFDWVVPAAEGQLDPHLTMLTEVPPGYAQPAAQSGEGELRILASRAQLDWHLARERFYLNAQNRSPLACRGVRLANGAEAVWMAYAKTRELLVLWTNVKSDTDAAQLLRAGQKVAFDAGLKQVRLWETTPLRDMPGNRVSRDGELPMFRPLGAQVSRWSDIQRVHWV